MSNKPVDLVGKTLEQLQLLGVNYIIEAQIIDGKEQRMPIEDSYDYGFYYITVSGDTIVKSMFAEDEDEDIFG